MNNKIAYILAKLPSSPGVYIMKDLAGEIIYIGKAKNLKNRVSSYFNKTTKNLKTSMLVSRIDSIEYILVASEQDAFSLENNLIKKHKPKYNILLKDDKNFPYLKIDKTKRYPTIEIARKVKNDGALYFGPYVTGARVSDLIDIIKSVFKIRKCKTNFNKTTKIKRACLYNDINNCLAPCTGKISEEEYNKEIDKVIDFLNGKHGEVKKLLTNKMNEFANNMEFEQAIDYRKRLQSLAKSEVYILTSLTKETNFDCFSILKRDEFVALNKMSVRGGKTIADQNFSLEVVEFDDLNDLLKNYIVQYYEQNTIPTEVLVNLELGEDFNNFLSELYNKSIDVKMPKIGSKKKILEMSIKNASEYLEKNYDLHIKKQAINEYALSRLAEVIGIDNIPYRIECYDISNISGTNTVSSMVVFEKGVPAKKEYRKFKIRTVDGPNDFACMNETLSRRFLRLKNDDAKFKMPDLIVIDGGLGQLGYANDAMTKLGYNIPIISLAKQNEEIFTIYSNQSIKLKESDPARKLLQRIRDEAHRFAITYHRLLRDKSEFKIDD